MLNKKEKKRVAELHRDIYSLEHSGKRGFCPALIPLYQEMQTLYRKQEQIMSKMGNELERLLDENKSELWEALATAREDINWMLNNRKFLNPTVFDYIDEVLDKIRIENNKGGE